MSDHRIPDMCDPDNRHRHECPICHEVEECDDTQCRFLYAGFGSQPGDELAPPASPVLCSGKSECLEAQRAKVMADVPVIGCVSCDKQTQWNVEGRCYDCDKHDVPPRNTTPRCACGKPSEISTDTETGFVEQCRTCYEQPRDTARLPLHEQLRAWTDELKQLGDDMRLIQAVAHKNGDAAMILVMEKLLKKYALLS
jgi:hypothetical protein